MKDKPCKTYASGTYSIATVREMAGRLRLAFVPPAPFPSDGLRVRVSHRSESDTGGAGFSIAVGRVDVGPLGFCLLTCALPVNAAGRKLWWSVTDTYPQERVKL